MAAEAAGLAYERLYFDHLFRDFQSVHSVELGRKTETFSEKTYVASVETNLKDFDQFYHPLYGSCFAFDPREGFADSPEYLKVKTQNKKFFFLICG